MPADTVLPDSSDPKEAKPAPSSPRLCGAAAVYKATAIIFLNTFLLFVFLNALAYFLMEPRTEPAEISEYASYFSVAKKLKEDVSLSRRVHGERPWTEVLELLRPPLEASHPTLEFMEKPIQSKYYNVGVEDMRYTRYVNAQNAAQKISGSYWVFGGSTTFGHGIADDETIPYYLNELDGANTYINFGFQAAHQNLEIDKLLLLLKKGYRPKGVLFIDGLNDITAMKNTSFHPAETPMRNYSAYGYLSNMEVLNRTMRFPSWTVSIRGLPIAQWVLDMRERRDPSSGAQIASPGVMEDIYDLQSSYHQAPFEHYAAVSVLSQDWNALITNVAGYQDKIVAYYRMNDAFLDHVASAFQFDYAIFLQPLGNLYLKNAFIKEPAAYVQTPHYRYYQSMASRVRSEIPKGTMGKLIDISQVDAECVEPYADPTHYSPELCKVIARHVLDAVRNKNGS